MSAQKILVFLFFSSLSFAQFAESDGDISVFGLEVEKLLNLLSGFLSLGLLALTIIAYQRTRNKRLAFVSAAFFLFAAKGFLTSIELFGLEWPLVDPLASFLNFFILLSFFLGILRK